MQQEVISKSEEPVASTRLLEGLEEDVAMCPDGDDLSTRQCDSITSKQKKEVAIFLQNNGKEEMKNWKLVPPDGGWGWLVLLGSTMVNVLVPGTVKSFGVLFVEFLEVFEATPAAAAWIPALCYFLYSSLGPVSSILSLKYSYRTVTILGGTCAALGMILSYFANSVAFLYISYGVLVGTGAGLSFPPTVYIVTSYFVKLRGLANGLCISGSAIGSIILPPILRILLEIYDYRGAVLLMGAVTLNVWVAALFYDPVEKHMKKVPKTEAEMEEAEEMEEQPLKPKFIISSDDTSSLQLNRNDSFVDNNDITKNSFIRSASSVAVPNYRSHGYGRERKISVGTNRGEMTRVRSGIAVSNMNSASALNSVPEVNNGFESPSRQTSTRRKVPRRSPSTSSFQYVSTPYHGSTLTLQPEMIASSFSLKSVTKETKETEKTNKLVDLSLLKDPLYLIILISNSTNAIGYTNFIILLPSFAIDLGYGKDAAALLLSIVSALDLVGRIGGSALSDLNLIPKQWYFIGGLLISGISLAIMPYFETYVAISIFCSIFGLASGIYVGVTAVIMADMLGTERLQSTYGISLFVNGILQLIGPPLCGLWYQSSKSYVSLFSTLGIVLIVGAAIWGFVPFVKRKRASNSDLET
ncbi:PREDICTED: monocarboxylate transporter 1 isoform X1 [Nicrophorus vespilloides]|uniref:Monocarboxylate transporter 1 isoform X1 n=2 Tax=Nicrophorus vespilloides TaxID=110193 RepID=A0ABM1M5F2_NICVS|nr:PREDICTED: monocarboxylate transporter 1 isoform X1 [Nicrophorus vespilloides]XP_017769803.1 PREDICTED: monocarboxylate transporter 1 isoform X1 [Nicrophorus vespilloides]